MRRHEVEILRASSSDTLRMTDRDTCAAHENLDGGIIEGGLGVDLAGLSERERGIEGTK